MSLLLESGDGHKPLSSEDGKCFGKGLGDDDEEREKQQQQEGEEGAPLSSSSPSGTASSVTEWNPDMRCFALASIAMLPFVAYSLSKVQFGAVASIIYLGTHAASAPLAIYLQDRSGKLRWLCGFVCLLLMSGIKTMTFLQLLSATRRNTNDIDEDDDNDEATMDTNAPSLAAKGLIYAFTALWECSNAVLIFGGRAILSRYGITNLSRAFLAVLCPAQLKFIPSLSQHDQPRRWTVRSLHLFLYILSFLSIRLILLSYPNLLATLQSNPIFEAETIVIIISCMVHLCNLPSHLYQLLLLLHHPDQHQPIPVQIIYPYGTIYTATTTKQFWSRWSRPATTLLLHMIYHPLGGSHKPYISIPILFFLNASGHYDVSNALVGDRSEMGWNVVFGVLGIVATLEVLGDAYFANGGNEEEMTNRNRSGPMMETASLLLPTWYRMVRWVFAMVSLRFAAYFLLHYCLHLSLSDLV